jgi:hypothetical protein
MNPQSSSRFKPSDCFFPITLFALSLLPAVAQIELPVTRQDNVREVIHGTEIVDELSLKVAFLGWQLGMK